jgi:hypothetical protein
MAYRGRFLRASFVTQRYCPRAAGFDPSQPRDDHGRWIETGAGVAIPSDVRSREDLEAYSTLPAYDDGTNHFYTHAVRRDSELEEIEKKGIQPNQAGKVYASASPTVRDRGAGYVVFSVAKSKDDSVKGLDVVEEGLSYDEYTFKRTISPSELYRVVPVVTDKTGFRIRADELAKAFLRGSVSKEEAADLPSPYSTWIDL